MKTGYEKHFNKVKHTAKAPAFNVKLQKNSSPAKADKSGKRSSFPIKPLMSFILLAAVGLLFLDNVGSVENALKKVEFSMSTAQAEEKKPEMKVDSKSEMKPSTVVAASPETKALTVEGKKLDDAEYMFKLAERKKQLDQRENDLNKMAEQIEKQKIEIAANLTKLEETRTQISKALEEKIKVDDVKVETLVQMYTNMKPAQAAKIFETLDEDLVIEVLGRMKKKSAADILNLIKPEKAQIFAERYTGYRTPASK